MGQVLCCFDEKRQYYYNQRGLGAPDKYDDDLEVAAGADISLKKEDRLRLTGGSQYNQHGMSETESTNELFAIDKRPHQVPQQMAVARKTLLGERNAESLQELKKEDSSGGGARNLMDYEEQEEDNKGDDTKTTTMSTQPNTQSRQQYTEDGLQEYEFPESIGDDQEFEELSALRNADESELKFSKRGITEYIETLFLEESQEENNKVWDLKLNKEDIKVYIKTSGGSQFNKEQPYIKTEILFNAAYSMRKIIEVIFNPKHRQQWDKNILQLHETPLETLSSSLAIVRYQQNKGVLNMNHREFLDKQLRFSDSTKGTYYIFYSSLPDGNETYDTKGKQAKTDRAYTIIGVQKMERRAEDGKIVYTLLMQCDLKMSITPKLIQMFLPSGMQEWMNKCNKYLNNNYDKI